jgi:hypothetical protein
MRFIQGWLIFFLIFLIGCGKGSTNDPLEPPVNMDPDTLGGDTTVLHIICPADTTLVLYSASVEASSIQLPLPSVSTNCSNGELIILDDRPGEFLEGNYVVKYLVKNGCGDSELCAFRVNAIDYRRKLLGTYSGNERYTGNYGQIFISDIYREIEVTLGPDGNDLIIDGDEVEVDSSGGFPYPSCCEYRFYDFQFLPDSIFIYKNYGPIASAYERRFKGKKK